MMAKRKDIIVGPYTTFKKMVGKIGTYKRYQSLGGKMSFGEWLKW